MYQVNGYFLFSRPITKLNISNNSNCVYMFCGLCAFVFWVGYNLYKERLLVYLYIMLGLR